MFIRRSSLGVLLLVLCCVEFSNNASLSIYEQKKYKNLIEGQGLYSADDDVEVLTKSSFKARVYGQQNAWLIEFYNSWCGFCQRFAPSWKALASDVRSWKDKVSIGAVDCSDDDNSPICREFEIMAYPTLRYLHENYEEGPKKLGDDVQKGEDVNDHRRLLIKKIISEQQAGRGKSFPNIQPYNSSKLDHLFEGVPLNTKYVFLIFESNTTLGPEVAMDLQRIPQIAIRYALSDKNSVLMTKLGITKLPYMVVLTDENESQHFADGLHTRESLKMAIKQFLKPKQIVVPDSKTSEIFTGKWIEAPVPDMTSLLEARERKTLRDKVKKMGDVVFQVDLESALKYSLKQEVASVKSITGEKREALLAYLEVLVKYFPLGEKGRVFLIELRDKVRRSDPVLGSEINSLVSQAQTEGQKVFSSRQQWLACEGSSSKLRGFPCGLWKMFHFMTVNAVSRSSAEPKEVLQAMHGYIKHFFGCADCSRHFLDMAKQKDLEGVASLESAVLWLWMAHNDVNKRLAGDATEDPEYPKAQFPSAYSCPTCRNLDNSWAFPEVLKFLQNMYKAVNVRYIGADTSILHEGLKGPEPSGEMSLLKTIDSSMCIILYVASLLLIVILIRMFLKRGYRKKMYVHDLLGKV